MIEDDDKDHLPVPAGYLRVVLGLLIMVSGVLVAALSEGEWAKGFGLILFLMAPFIMLK